MRYRAISLDPGGTTGWAILDLDTRTGESHFLTGQLGPEEHHFELYNKLNEWYPPSNIVCNIVCESFEYRNMSRPGLELVSKEYIGVLNLFAQSRRLKVAYQTASQGKVREQKAFVKPSNIKKLGLWSPGNPHAMDALGHMLYFLIHNKNVHAHVRSWTQNDVLPVGWK